MSFRVCEPVCCGGSAPDKYLGCKDIADADKFISEPFFFKQEIISSAWLDIPFEVDFISKKFLELSNQAVAITLLKFRGKIRGYSACKDGNTVLVFKCFLPDIELFGLGIFLYMQDIRWGLLIGKAKELA